MEFWITISRLLRRRRVIVTVLLSGLLFGAQVYFSVPTRYVSTSTMVLTTTEFGGTESLDPGAPTDLTNPMLNFSESLRTTADMLIWSMSSKDVERALEREGNTDLVVNDGRTNPDLLGFEGPLIYVTAQGTDAAAAQATVVRASDQMREALVAWQYEMGAPRSTYITMVDVVAPTAAQTDRTPKVKYATLGFSVWVFVSIAVVYAIARRRSRRTRADQGDVEDRGDARHPHLNGRSQPTSLTVGSP